MKFAYYDDYLKWSNETEKRTDLTAEEKEQLIVSVYAENGGICGMSLLAAENKMQPKAAEIIDRLNELAAEKEDLGYYIIECVVDQREDEGLPPFTPEELAEAAAECDRKADIVTAIEAQMDDLQEDYYLLTGKFPHYYEATNRYGENWR
jgi:hypothetical protein